jgi:hypothetical protein
VSAGWVAGSVKARLMLGRRGGVETARRLAEAPSLQEAVAGLSGTAYAQAATAAELEEAQRRVAASVALQLRVLAAWLPPGGTTSLRALAAWFELANIEDRLAYLVGGPLRAPFELGVLASAWNAAVSAQSPKELRALLARSSWGDLGSSEVQEIHLALRFAWARRVSGETPEAGRWAAGAAAILLAEELLVAGRRVDPALARQIGLGAGWQGAETLDGLRARLPRSAAWALDAIKEPAELLRAEQRWWRLVEAEAEQIVARGTGREVVVGTVALLGLDAVRIATALAVAAQAGATGSREVLDALC